MYGIEKTSWGKLLNEREILNETVTTDKLLQIISKRHVTVRKITKDSNSYGEFVFIVLSAGKTAMEFYGAGFHEIRGRWLIGEWKMFTIPMTGLAERKVDKDTARMKIELEETIVRSIIRREGGRTERTELDDLADIMDDDGLAAELEDNPGLVEELGVGI